MHTVKKIHIFNVILCIDVSAYICTNTINQIFGSIQIYLEYTYKILRVLLSIFISP